jgi:CubicO group peptidase (beta-lactamase class C family)
VSAGVGVILRMTRSSARKRTLLSTVILLAIAPPALGASLDQKRIDAVFAKQLPKDGPGCAIGIYERGKPVMLKGYGLANLENRVPVTPDTVFNIGSVSKQFTAMAAIILADQGKLGLDDDIRTYLPELPDYGTKITIRQLIHHTSGIRNYFDVLFLKGLSQRDPVTPDEAYALLTGLTKLQFTPGSRARYSNSGYFLLGRIIERVSGMTLARFETQNIFAPLGMTRTHVHDDLGLVVPDRAYGYLQAPKGGFRSVTTQIEITGDGAVFTTVRDLAKWDADFYQGKVWRPAVKAEMLRAGLLENGQKAEAEPGVVYAGGLTLGQRRGLNYVSHGGKDLGFMADLTRYPDQQTTVALLCNQILRIGDLVDGVTDLLLAAAYTQPASVDPERPRPKEPEATPLTAALRDALPGTYYSREIDARYVIAAEDGELVLRIGPHLVRAGALRALDNETIGAGRFPLTLQRDAQGRIVGLVVEGFTFLRV